MNIFKSSLSFLFVFFLIGIFIFQSNQLQLPDITKELIALFFKRKQLSSFDNDIIFESRKQQVPLRNKRKRSLPNDFEDFEVLYNELVQPFTILDNEVYNQLNVSEFIVQGGYATCDNYSICDTVESLALKKHPVSIAFSISIESSDRLRLTSTINLPDGYTYDLVAQLLEPGINKIVFIKQISEDKAPEDENSLYKAALKDTIDTCKEFLEEERILRGKIMSGRVSVWNMESLNSKEKQIVEKEKRNLVKKRMMKRFSFGNFGDVINSVKDKFTSPLKTVTDIVGQKSLNLVQIIQDVAQGDLGPVTDLVIEEINNIVNKAFGALQLSTASVETIVQVIVGSKNPLAAAKAVFDAFNAQAQFFIAVSLPIPPSINPIQDFIDIAFLTSELFANDVFNSLSPDLEQKKEQVVIDIPIQKTPDPQKQIICDLAKRIEQCNQSFKEKICPKDANGVLVENPRCVETAIRLCKRISQSQECPE